MNHIDPLQPFIKLHLGVLCRCEGLKAEEAVLMLCKALWDELFVIMHFVFRLINARWHIRTLKEDGKHYTCTITHHHVSTVMLELILRVAPAHSCENVHVSSSVATCTRCWHSYSNLHFKKPHSSGCMVVGAAWHPVAVDGLFYQKLSSTVVYSLWCSTHTTELSYPVHLPCTSRDTEASGAMIWVCSPFLSPPVWLCRICTRLHAHVCLCFIWQWMRICVCECVCVCDENRGNCRGGCVYLCI